MANPTRPSLLYVDDEQSSLTAFKASFRKYYQVFTANNLAEAQKVLAENTINILLTDQRMPGTFGTTLLEYAVANYPRQVRILISAFTDYAVLLNAVQKGHIVDFVEKPWDTDDLKKRIDYAYTVYFGNMEAEFVKDEAEKAKKIIDKNLKDLLGDSD